MTITKEKYVTIAYSFSTPDGFLLGTSDRQGPLTFCAGSGDIISGLDSNLIGVAEGENKKFVVSAAEAYGVRDESLVAELSATDLGLDIEPKVGYRIEAQIGGRWRSALISEVANGKVTVDANHPLAGVDLHFDCTVLGISDEAPVQESCGCGGGGCGGSCGSSAEGSTDEQASGCGGCGGSCDCK
ncbi:MAG: FKBP-type peptidyl-prolyl cis-trans isomerase [Spirochaetales bacterium]